MTTFLDFLHPQIIQLELPTK